MRARCVGRLPLRCDERRSELPLCHTAVTRSARSGALTSCVEIPCVAAITSGTVTSLDTTTESDDALEHVASEKVAFLIIESTARSYTVASKSTHVIPAMSSDTTTIGVRVGLGVGTGVGCAVVGTGVGTAVGKGAGTDDGTGDGARVGTDDGTGGGADVGTGVGASVGTGVGRDDGTGVGTEVGA